MRYFLELAYRGAPFHGWQVQPGVVTVQSTIEDALRRLTGSDVPITGAGRTDAGVNARMMVAHFDAGAPLSDPDGLVRKLNAVVGKDIAVQKIWEVAPDSHARFDAVSRTYHYYAVTEKTPFFYPLSWKAPATLDFEAMNRAAEILLETSDFTSFSKLHTDVKTNICRVSYARWERLGDHEWVFVITADRFLRNMVRAVVGTLVEVGRGKMSIERFREVIDRRDRCAAGTSMPGEALFLWEVKY